MRIGIDVGGTFTDLVLVDDRSGRIWMTKVPTTPKALADGVLAGIEKVLALAGRPARALRYLVHGTTIGTNALIERKGARTGLLTTEGFRDVLEIGRIQRPKEGLYDLFVDNPPPLVPRHLRREVRERVGSQGEVVTPLDEATARAAVEALKAEGVEAVAVSLLFSFLNPAHEQRVRELCRALLPETSLSLSSEVAPEFREYERTSTAVLNAYLQPVVERYLAQLLERLAAKYGEVDLRIMQANGGTITAEAARTAAVKTVNSGPAGGVMAGAWIGRLTGDRKLITVDMGGTSFDIGVIEGGIPTVTSDGKFAGYPVKIPIIDIDTIGAGGGSIAWIDKGGVLNVGPQSAGADPGPACYGLGGSEPTVTDANLVLGRVDPAYFLGGEMPLDPELARRAIRTRVAKPLGLSLEEAAAGIIRLVNANMVKGIGVNSIERGLDVREFALIAFGGAGPLHAAELARELAIRRVVVPPYPAALSAFGLLVSDTRHDYVRTIARRQSELQPADLLAAFLALEEAGRAQLARERVPPALQRYAWSTDLRYEGQSYELATPVERTRRMGRGTIERIVARFNALHQQVYAYSSVDEETEFINVRVAAIGRVPPVRLPRGRPGGASPGRALKARRPVYFSGTGFVPTTVYERDRLAPGQGVPGPALIEEPASVTVVPPGWGALVDPYRNLVLALRGRPRPRQAARSRR